MVATTNQLNKFKSIIKLKNFSLEINKSNSDSETTDS